MNQRSLLTLEGIANEVAHVRDDVGIARDDARKARDSALDVHQRMGTVARELGNIQKYLVAMRASLEGKGDATIQDFRDLRLEFRKLRTEVLAMRPKLDSLSELEPELSEEVEDRRESIQRRKDLLKWGRRAVVAFVVGAATVAGAAGAGTLLKDCSHGRIVVPEGTSP